MAMEITYLGHSGLLLSDGREVVAIDPFLTGNPGAVHKASEIRCGHIVLTHGHADHVGDVVSIAKANGAAVYAGFELSVWCAEQGVKRVEGGNPGGRIGTGFGFVAFTQAFHSSSYEGRSMGVACGVVVGIGGRVLYHTGDTCLFGDMRLIGEMYRPDVAAICAGDRFTMGPESAGRAAEMIGARLAIPIHWGTWPMLASDMSGFKPKGVEVRVMKAGESWKVE